MKLIFESMSFKIKSIIKDQTKTHDVLFVRNTETMKWDVYINGEYIWTHSTCNLLKSKQILKKHLNNKNNDNKNKGTA